MEDKMKKILISMALGAVAGMLIGEIPQVKSVVKKGKKKVKDIID